MAAAAAAVAAAQRSLPAPFLTKTYQLVDDPATDEIVSWNETGTTFIVWKTADFARDMLPIYFKHNNFSSFVRQLNTYGFRKIAQDKWEFANDNFRRGEKELLHKIRRRKTATLPTTSNSGEDIGSTSSTSPDSKNMGSIEMEAMAQFADLTEENDRLRRDNETLNSELAQAKKQCEELVGYLTGPLKVAPDQIESIMNKAKISEEKDGDKKEDDVKKDEVKEDDVVEEYEEEEEEEEEDGEEEETGVRLFGVWLKTKKGKKKKKRRRDEKMKRLDDEPQAKEMKAAVETHAPLMTSSNISTTDDQARPCQPNT